jgi:spore coat polysaccharide biosynthesis predicted glycosyltransferase SpsG/RimJ/RimL family protein N-acetyltransferase
MRCLALAQATIDAGHSAVLATAAMLPSIQRRFAAEGAEVMQIHSGPPAGSRDARQTRDLALACGADWVVVDGYDFGTDYLAALRGPWQLMLIDDIGRRGLASDVVLNPNAYATRRLYPAADRRCRMLLGTRFALLRREFRATPQPVTRKQVDRLLVTLGGGDSGNVMERLVAALSGGPWGMQIVFGAGSGRGIRHQSPRIEVLRDVPSLEPLLRHGDLVVGAGGTSAIEFARAGAPSVLVELADNQRRVIRSLVRAGAAVSAGPATSSSLERRVLRSVSSLSADSGRRRAMAAAGRRLVDGRGAQRVLEVMEQGVLSLRPASQDDARRLFEWANERAVRLASFQTRRIGWDEHVAWLRSRLRDDRTRIWIGEAEGVPVGVVRFEPRGGRETISVTVAAGSRGAGLGTRLITAGSSRIFDEKGIGRIDAWLQPGNVPSMRAFAAAGFRRRQASSRPSGVPPEAVLMSLSAPKHR